MQPVDYIHDKCLSIVEEPFGAGELVVGVANTGPMRARKDELINAADTSSVTLEDLSTLRTDGLGRSSPQPGLLSGSF